MCLRLVHADEAIHLLQSPNGSVCVGQPIKSSEVVVLSINCHAHLIQLLMNFVLKFWTALCIFCIRLFLLLHFCTVWISVWPICMLYPQHLDMSRRCTACCTTCRPINPLQIEVVEFGLLLPTCTWLSCALLLSEFWTVAVTDCSHCRHARLPWVRSVQ